MFCFWDFLRMTFKMFGILLGCYCCQFISSWTRKPINLKCFYFILFYLVFLLIFLSCLGYSIGTSKLHPHWLKSSANLTTFIWFWAQRCADTQRTSPSSSFKKASPHHNHSPMPLTNLKICLQLSTIFLFTSFRFPRSKSSMSSFYASFLPAA